MQTPKASIKCTIFNGLKVIGDFDYNYAIDIGTGKISFQVIDPRTNYYMSYDPTQITLSPEVSDEINDILGVINHCFIQKGITPEIKPSGIDYGNAVTNLSIPKTIELMNIIIDCLTGFTTKIVATGIWRQRGIESRDNLIVVSADDELALTAISLLLIKENPDISFTGSPGVALSRFTDLKLFKKSSDFEDLYFKVLNKIYEKETFRDTLLMGSVFEMIRKSVVYYYESNENSRKINHYIEFAQNHSIHYHGGSSSSLLCSRFKKHTIVDFITINKNRGKVINPTDIIFRMEDHEQIGLIEKSIFDFFNINSKTENTNLQFRNFIMKLNFALSNYHNNCIKITDLDVPEPHITVNDHLLKLNQLIRIYTKSENRESFDSNIQFRNDLMNENFEYGDPYIFETLENDVQKYKDDVKSKENLSIQILKDFPYNEEHITQLNQSFLRTLYQPSSLIHNEGNFDINVSELGDLTVSQLQMCPICNESLNIDESSGILYCLSCGYTN